MYSVDSKIISPTSYLTDDTNSFADYNDDDY